MQNRRTDRKRGQLSDKKIAQLDELGFIWDPLSKNWNDYYKALIQYKKEFKTTAVPLLYKTKEGRALGTWTQQQRAKRAKLSLDQIKKLDEIDFIWKVEIGRNQFSK